MPGWMSDAGTDSAVSRPAPGGTQSQSQHRPGLDSNEGLESATDPDESLMHRVCLRV